MAEAVETQTQGIDFPCVIYVHPLRLSIGSIIEELELIATAATLDELRNTIQFLPL